MNRRRVGFLLIGAGILLGLIAGITVYLRVSQAEEQARAVPTLWVAVAASDIPERTVISSNQIAFVQLPLEAVPPGAKFHEKLPDPQVPSTRQRLLLDIVDQFSAQRIYKNEVILTERLGKQAAKNTPSYDLPAGKVAFTFPVKLSGGTPANDRLTLAFINAIRAGDFVDIYFSNLEPPAGLSKEDEDRAQRVPMTYLQTRRVLQNIKVLFVGHYPDATGKAIESPKDERFLTLEVTPDEALTIKWLKDAAQLAGNIDFVLRSPLDTQPFPATTVNLELMSRQHGFGPGR